MFLRLSFVLLSVVFAVIVPDYISDKGTPVLVNPAACEQDSLAIRVRVENIKKTRGQIVLDLHNDIASEFLEADKVILRVRQDVTGKEMDVCIPITQPGNYAVGAYHDKNGNMKFDKNILGLPKERFGTSGNPKYGRKKPSLLDCIIAVGEQGSDITINLVSASSAMKGK